MAKYLHLGDSRLIKLRGQVKVNVFFLKTIDLVFHMVALVLMTMMMTMMMMMMMMAMTNKLSAVYLISYSASKIPGVPPLLSYYTFGREGER